MKVLIESRRRVQGVRREEVEKTALRILRLLCSSDVELSILLIGDGEMTEINREYRGFDRSTDVLAFSMREGEFGAVNENILGDIVISLDKAKEQARERGVTIMEETSFLLLHGILHLYGYDHEGDDAERVKMEDKEREIFDKLRELRL